MILVALALASPPAALESALTAELQRTATLQIPGAPAPYNVSFDLLDGHLDSSFSEFGAPVSRSSDPYRSLRVEVRVGDYTLDSSNFQGLGIPDAVVQLPLPEGDSALAHRREVWLATDRAYKAAVQLLSRKQAALSQLQSPRAADWTPAPPVVDRPTLTAPQTQGDRLAALASLLSGALRDFPALELGQAVSRDWQGLRLHLSSTGSTVWSDTGYSVLRVEGTVRLGDGTEVTNARSWVTRRVDDLPSEAELLAQTRAMASWLSNLPGARPEDDYLGPVVFLAPAAVELMSQLLAPQLVGTPPMVEDAESMFEMGGRSGSRLGRRLLPEGWTIVDDVPSAPAPVRYGYDQEGVAPKRVELVRNGVLVEQLMSRMPNLQRAVSTGHGRSLGTNRRGAMPSNVVITPKKTVSARSLVNKALSLAAQTGKDYVIVVGALQPPALDGKVQFAVTGEDQLAGLTSPYEAWRLYADGRTEPIPALRFVGVDRRVLRDIVAAGASTGVTMLDGPPGAERYTIGPTGGIPVRWEAPAVLISEMELRGGAGGEPRELRVRALP